MPTRSKGAFQVQKWYRSHASGYSDGGGRTTQMIIGKRRSGGTRHEKLSGNGDTECASPWQEDGPGVMSLCPFRFFSFSGIVFFSHAFLGWVAVVEQSSCAGEASRNQGGRTRKLAPA
jgi:hypothetical protein